ncbi:MAG: polymer-forming cytoskeletal protein [Lachnospiraceae bacterium]|jgi:cytoskeletal protein CcmA (bactofilin family)|nr:polymer-forming cytoskeletal protein [Lachnospiraceae bacterium]
MSFFKDFKEDLSQAVNELMPEEEFDSDFEEEEMVNTLEEEDGEVSDELDQLNGFLDNMEAKEEAPEFEEITMEEPQAPAEPEFETIKVEEPEPAPAAPVAEPAYTETIAKEEKTVDTTNSMGLGVASDTITTITKGTRIIGSIESEGSVEIAGIVEGNVLCNGKITITGAVKGDTTSSEFFADSARLEGEVRSSGTVKVGLGSVIVGNVEATSAVIAGAVKGDIDVQGPVVVDTSAVVMGNIKSRSVQINNGAVIEGFCSQCYADIDVKGIFGE